MRQLSPKLRSDVAVVKKRLTSFARQWEWDSPIPLAMRLKFKIFFFSFELTLLAGYNQPPTNAEVIELPKVAFESSAILSTIKAPSKGYNERDELRKALASLTDEQIIRLTPDEGESMRKLKRMVTEAGKDIDRQVKHIEDGGDLLVFVPAPKAEGATRRGRPKKAEENGSQ